MPEFLLPDLGEGLAEAEILAWHVQAGDEVTVDQVVAEVETAKAAVEVPIPFAGVVAELHGEPGTIVTVGQPLISITEGATEPASPEPADESSGRVLVGYGTTSAPPSKRRAARRAAGHRRGPVPVISPLVRKLAQDAGLDLTTVTGTGPSGLVRREDVRRALAERAAPPPATAEVPAAS